MTEIIFLYDGTNIKIQCNKNEKMKDIINKFIIKTQIDKNSVYYLYKGKKINEELEIEKVNEEENLNKMTIIVNKLNEENKNNNLIKSKSIICPQCKEQIMIKIKDYKIELYNCKNGHIIKDILLNKFEETQKLDISKIIYDKCKENNKSNTYNNEFYRCINCKINLCPSCKSIHDKTHFIINYEKKDYICDIHKEDFIKYCNECKINFCLSCINEHKTHINISYENIMPDIDKIKEEMKILRSLIDNLNNDLNIIIKEFKKILENMEIYYNIYKDIITIYENKNRNYEIINNINEMNIYNIIKDLEKVNNENNINNKVNNILNIYDKMNNNSLKILYKNGNKYIGELKNNIKEGKGIIYYYNGGRYEGEWANDNYEGKGIEYFNNGNRYEGYFKNGKFEGKGIFYWNQGDKYEGDWKNSQIEGKGIMYYYNGGRYEGNWKNNKREGKGVFYYNNFDRYEGDFKNGNREGKGIFYYNNGDREMGNYLNDKRIGKHITLKLNGIVLTNYY